MKLQIKTLNQNLLIVDIEPSQTVFDLKKELSLYPDVGVQPEFQKLIYAGKILNNQDQLKTCNIDIKKFLVVMTLKQPLAKGPLNENKVPIEGASNITTASVEPILPNSGESPIADTASAMETSLLHPDKNQLVEQIVNMGYEEIDVRRALEASFDNPERAIEYLIEGIPISNPNETALPDEDSEDSELSMYEMIRADSSFQFLQSTLEHNPELVSAAIQQADDSNPALLNSVGYNQQDILNMLANVVNTDVNEGGEQVSEEDSADDEF
uniref:UV excision repair protein RAD23 n=1 Tax=Glossina brevipalpis TaxID=37001 RepID=A0A1A9WNH2_9MUSC